MKQKLLKSLLAIAVLCAGSSSVWGETGDETVVVNIVGNEGISDGVLTGSVNRMVVGDNTAIENDHLRLGHNQTNTVTLDESQRAGYGRSSNHDIVRTSFDISIGNANGLYGAVYLKDASGNNIAYFRYGPWNGGSETNLGLTLGETLFYKTNNGDWSRKTHFDIEVDYLNNSITTKYSGYATNNVGVTVALENRNPVASIAIVSNSGNGGDARRTHFGNLVVTNVEGDYSVSSVDYTINYKDGEKVVKTVRSSEAEGNTITALTAIDGEGDYAGNHYLITAAEAPSMVLDSDAENILEVPVRAPYTATLRVTTTIGGTPSVVDTPLTETDGKVCNWSFAYPKYAAKDGIYYLCDASTFVQSGTFSDDEIVERTVTYTTPDVSIVGFSEIGSGTNGAYSNGGYTVTNSQLATATVDAGNYMAYISVIGKGGSGSNYRQEGVVVGGVQVASTTGNTTGLKSLSFTVSENNTEVYVKGNGTLNYTDELDYVLIRRVDIAAGTYYLKNKATGAYFAAGLNYGTKAMTNTIGHTVTLSQQSLGYNIDTKISNGGDNHYLNGVWTDGAASVWDFLSDGDGYYAINNGTGNLTAGAVGAEISIALSVSDNAKWQLLTESEWKAEQVERLDAATASNGVDATFYIPAANFNRNDNTENNKWQGSPTINGLSENSAATNYNAQKYNTASFDVYQELTGLKPGAYKLTAQGFYRNGTTNDRNAILYANSFETPLVSIRTSGATEADTSKGLGTNNDGIYVPNVQSDAAKAFNAGLYNNELYFVVGEGGTLRVGVKKNVEAEYDWAVFDNFQLTYYGTTITGTIPSSGLGSLASAYGLDFSSATVSEGELTAYVVNEITVDKAKVTPVNEMPANSGVILEGTSGATYSIPVKADAAAFAGTNYLRAAVTATDVAANQAYILQSGEFHLVTAASTVPAGKAYLLAENVPSDAKALSFDFGDADGINTVQGSEFKVQDSEIFNLAGQRMSKLQRGVNIVNGKKILVK